MFRLIPLVLLLGLTLSQTSCLLLAVGAEAGYVAGQDKSPSETVHDQWLLAKVKTALISNTKVAARHINVDVHLSQVTLTGVVSSKKEKKAALKEARKVKGVKKVIDKLHISR